MKMKQDAYYDVVSLTSMGLRMSPNDGKLLHMANSFSIQVTSAESNVLTPLASLGLMVKVLTKFIKDNPMSHRIKQALRQRGILYDDNDIVQDSPWGLRHQINFVEPGVGRKPPVVFNDRANEVAKTLRIDDIDMADLFNHKGVKILHISGLFLALSEQTAKVTLSLVKQAKASGTKISFDINYRPSFWLDRKKQLQPIFQEMVGYSDILFASVFDCETILDQRIHKDARSDQTYFKALFKSLMKACPNLSYIITKERIIEDANHHAFGAYAWRDNQMYHIEPLPITVVDRVGGGDAFTGGILYGLLSDMPVHKHLSFAWAMSVLAMSVDTDYVMPLTEQDIWDIWHNNPHMKR
ncbi:MAG: sugar kinase [Candidatus Izemoplasma sp.]|nr:sugar kinase [Candidatus Izemoplasma sp.]